MKTPIDVKVVPIGLCLFRFPKRSGFDIKNSAYDYRKKDDLC